VSSLELMRVAMLVSLLALAIGLFAAAGARKWKRSARPLLGVGIFASLVALASLAAAVSIERYGHDQSSPHVFYPKRR
jgi:hypothetical protein